MKGRNYHIIILMFIVCIIIEIKSIAQNEEIKNGYVKFYYPNGQVSSEGIMIDGKPEGYWITYYVTGIKKSEGIRKSHMLDSIWIFYDNKGDTAQRISYMYGKKNGYYLTYNYENTKVGYSTGTIISKELYINDKKEGKSFYFYPDGSLKSEVNYTNGKREGLSKEYNEGGMLITLAYFHNGYMTEKEEINRTDKNGMKQGVWREYYTDGKVKKEEIYKDNMLNGQYKEFDEKGNIILFLNYMDGKIEEKKKSDEIDVEIRNEYNDQNILVSSGTYRNNIPVGIHRTYNNEGNVISTRIYDELGRIISEGIIDEEGNRKGDWKDYYTGGKIKATGNYENNLKTGRWTFYNENGNIEQSGEYVKGKISGIWTWYFNNGKIEREEYFFNGKEDGLMVEYLNDGRIITKGDYVEGEKEGEWYYRVGDHIEVGSYITGLRNGIWKYFYNDSTLKFEGNFLQGNPDGKQEIYYENGMIKEERFYVMGIREKNWKRYDEEGNLVMTITFKNDVETRINGIKTDLPQRDIRLIE